MNGIGNVKELAERFKGLFSKRKSSLLFFFGIAGMCLILVSTILPEGKKQNPALGGEELASQVYTQQLEERLTKLVQQIDGVGKCQVMVTMETDVEYVYAVEETQKVNETNSYEDGEALRLTQQQDTQQKYIVVDAGNGKKEALLKTRKAPSVQGVVVVCEGAKNATVQERVTQAVTIALGIPYNKVCVTKIRQ